MSFGNYLRYVENQHLLFSEVSVQNFYKGWISEIRFQTIFPFLRDIPRMKILDVITAYCFLRDIPRMKILDVITAYCFLRDIPGVKISDAITIDC